MKKSLLCMAACAFMLHTQASASQTTPVLMPQFGKQVIEVQPNDTITYLDYMGYGAMTDRTANSAYATTVFRPAQEGYAIYIEFDTVHVVQIADNNPSCLKIYNGIFDTTSVTYPAEYKDCPQTVFPYTANQLDSLTISSNVGGVLRHKTYLSTDPTGALSCCFRFGGAKYSHGWNAKVYALANKAQTVTAAQADYSQMATSVYAGEKNVSLGAVSLLTEGVSPVETLTSISFTLPDKTVFDPAQLSLYRGNATRTILPTASTPYTGITARVETTFSEDNGTYTFTMSEPLELADNTFCIGGDVLETAPWDAVATLNITAVTTAKGAVPVTAVTPAAQKVQAMVLLEAGKHQTIDVNRNDIHFYDNGGPEGKRFYEEGAAAGTVTFRPTTEGNRVMVYFNTIAIYWGNSTNHDTLSIYNGSEVNETNLLYTSTKGSEGDLLIRSTAEDGALTVRFGTNNTSYSYGIDGWDAIVSEYAESGMKVASATVTKQSGKPLAGDKDVRITDFMLQTEETGDPLQPESFTFSTGNTYPAISHVKLYYTANSSSFSTTNLLAEADVTGDVITLQPTELPTFNEGKHYFFVVADLSAKAQTGDSININITKVAFNNHTEYTDFTNPKTRVIVKNVITSEVGEKTYTICGSWEFGNPEQYGSFDVDTKGDHITTFIPATEGKVVKMHFTEFNVALKDWSWVEVATTIFKVYNGKGTTGELLFEVKSIEDATKLPEDIISTAADGALTVVFNANNDNFYMGGSGWNATVSEYDGMKMASAKVTKLDASPYAGATDVQISRFLLTTTGTDDALQPTTFTLNTGDTYAAVSHVKLYYTGNSSRFSDKNLVAEADITADGFTLVPATALALAAGNNYFFLVADIDVKAQNDDAVDINITQVDFSNQTSFTDFTNPAGKATVQNKAISVAEAHTYIIASPWTFKCNYMYESMPDMGFDTWTPGDQVTTFIPATEGKKIKMSFSVFDVMLYESYDKSDAGTPATFTVYAGTTTEGNVLFTVTDKTTATALPKDITSTSADGAITVVFNSYGNYSASGAGFVSTVTEEGGIGTGNMDVAPAMDSDSVVKYINANGELIINRHGIPYNAAGQRLQ